MAKDQKRNITPELMVEYGWIKTDDHLYPFVKEIHNRNPLNASKDSEIKLVLHGMYNNLVFALLLPDGGLLNFVVNNMEELLAFEKSIDFYDPPF